MSCSDVFTKLYHKLKERLNVDEDEPEDPKIRCTFCTRKERISSFQELNKGDHICLGGENFMKNIKDRQIVHYTHHAIVKHVELLSDISCNATLIHFFSTPFDKRLRIQETTEYLHLSKTEIRIVKYCHPTLSPDEIIKRAQTLAESDGTYSVFECNCEHFCHWCCVNNPESFQVNSAFATIREVATGALNVGGKVTKAICMFLVYSLDDVLKHSVKANTLIGVPWGVIGIFIIIYLMYCIVKHYQFNQHRKYGRMCSRCCSNEKVDLWLKFFIYGSTQLGGIGLISLIITSSSGIGVVAAAIAIISVLTMALMHYIPMLKEKLSTPFKGKLVKVKSTENIWIGDVISFKNDMAMHDGIVSKVQKLSGENVIVGIVHYSKPHTFGRRIIEENEFTFDVNKDELLGHDYSGYNVHPPEQVVSRARQRIGETKHGLVSNRSCHLCHWAKVKNTEDDISTDITPISESEMKYDRDVKIGEDISDCRKININHRRERKHATKVLPKTWARIPEEIKAGEIIQFRYGTLNLWHSAVATEVLCTLEPSLTVTVTVVHYGQANTPCEETFTFDLRYEDVWIYKYHPSFRYNRKEIIRRARSRIGKGKYHVLYHRSFHLAKDIVQKDTDTLISDLTELAPGDVIVFYYWSLKHAAVVTKINNHFSKTNDKADVTIIHYALDGILATRTVKEETINMDFSKRKKNVYRKGYAGYVTYPPELVIKRARSRINEQRFHAFRNTSWDLVHWAKVIQTPAFVDIACASGVEKQFANTVDEKNVLIPKVGKTFEMFQRVAVQCWKDLQPGLVLEYRYYLIPHQGVIMDVDVKRSKVKLIHYGTESLFSKRTIMIDTIRVNIKRNKLWLYICDPELCDKPEIIVQKAYDRLGDQKWGRGNRSWDFCKSCVLKSQDIQLVEEIKH